MSQPSSPHKHGHADIQVDPFSSSVSASEGPVTRTVAIIKNHALEHRFDIEHRIQEAKFEVLCPSNLQGAIFAECGYRL
jgi:hypothetical protein